ncbi:hypothetical protein CR513_52241, partial [Mucuna pruriens]
MSSFLIPAGNSQSKELRRLARIRSNEAIAIGIPGQILRPAPNGINSKSCPRKSIVLSKNLSVIAPTAVTEVASVPATSMSCRRNQQL